MIRKVLILGASGQLGLEFKETLSQKSIPFAAPGEEEADITNQEAMERLIAREKPGVVVNCAAYNAVDDAESRPEIAYRVNAEAVGTLAGICRRHGAFLVHYSSDYVFDGKKEGLYTEDDAPNPLNVYGKSKLAGEEAVKSATGDYLVFRLSWVIGKGKQNFLYKLSRWMENNPVLRISADETSVPTFADDIVRITLMSLEKGLAGLYHLVSSDYASRYELARYFINKLGKTNLVIPVAIGSFQMPAPRPAFSAMSNRKLSEALGIQIPRWQEGVDRYFSFFQNK